MSSILEGEVAGLSNGVIRGVSTMMAMQTPLYVIDGFPVENTSITEYGYATEDLPVLNMEDIESITVLKDAAAASIYGARAANGVIVITTKKAKEGKTQISASATWTIHPYDYYVGWMTDAADIVTLLRKWAAENPELNNGLDRALAEANNMRNNSAYPDQGTDILLDFYTNKITQAEADAKLNELASRGYAYYDDVEKYGKRNSFYQQYYLSVGKATGRNNFMFSATYRNNKEEDIYTKNDQVGLNLKNTVQITDWLKADVSMYINFRNATEQTYDLLSPGYSFMPYDRLVDEDGNPVTWASQYSETVRNNIETYGLYDVDITPLDELGRRLMKRRYFTSRISGNLEIKPFSWLSYSAMYQYQYGINRSNQRQELESYATRVLINSLATLENGEVVYNLPEGDVMYAADQITNAYNFRQQLNVDKTFNKIHNLTWIIGQEIRNTKIESSRLTRYGYDAELLSTQYVDEPALTSGISGLMNYRGSISAPWAKSEMVNRFVSFYSNAAYSYDNRYTVSGSIRWDRSNLWGTNPKYQNKPLWSVGASWNINNEAFFKSSWVDMLKLRVSYGIGGNIAKDAAPYLTASYSTSSLVGGMYATVFSPPNPDLRWEKTTTVNVGVDFSMFENRLSGTFDFYNRYSDDLLSNRKGVATEGFGYSRLTFNTGAMRNRGFELTLQGNVIKREVVWNMRYMIGYNKNRVMRSDMENPAYYLVINSPESYPQKGKPYHAIYALRWAGINDEGNPTVYDNEGNITAMTGSLEFDDVYYKGSSVPIYNGSFTNTLSYKGFSLTVQMLYEGGHKFKRNTYLPATEMDWVGARTNLPVSITNKEIMNAWEKPGDENFTDVPRLMFGFSDGFNYDRQSIYQYVDLQVYNAGNIKINNISLSYDIPTEWVKKLALNGARLQFMVEDAAIIAFDKDAGFMLGTKNKPNYVLGLSLNF